MSGFYLFLSSSDSANIYANNSYKDFTVDFDREITLERQCGMGFRQEWQFALTELSVDFLEADDSLPEGVIVTCDLCSPSYIYGNEVQVLRTITSYSELSASLGQTYYIGVNKHCFNRIRISVLDRELKELSTVKGWPEKADLKCTLHFIRS